MKRAATLFSVVIASACPLPELGPIQVCSFETFDNASGSCPSDEREVNTRGVVCTLSVEGRRGQKASGKYFYMDELVESFEDDIGADSGSITFRFAREGMSRLPGGNWRCELTVGSETLTATFTSTAAQGPILDAAVCPGDATNAELGMCTEDQSSTGFADTQMITCSANIAGAKGKLVRTSLFRGQDIIGASMGITPDVQLSTYSKKFTSSNGVGYGAADYACRFFVDDEMVVEKPFTIHP